MPFDWRWDRIPDLTVAVSLSVIALLVLSCRVRARTNQIFAAFLFLVAGNFFASYFVVLTGQVSGSTEYFPRLGLFFLTLDPAFLAAFATLYPGSAEGRRSMGVVAGLLLVPVPFVVTQFFRPDLFLGDRPTALSYALYLYLGSAYVYSLVRLLWLGASIPTPPLRRQIQLLIVAFSLALIPRLALLPIDLGLAPPAATMASTLLRTGIAWGLFIVFVLVAMRMAPRGARAPALQALAAVTPFLAVVTVLWFADLRTAHDASSSFFVSLTWGGRWILFSGLVAFALTRYQLFDYEGRMRQVLLAAGVFLPTLGLLYIVPALLVPPGAARRPGGDFGLTEAAILAFSALALALLPLLVPLLFGRRDGEHDAPPGPAQFDAYRAVLETLGAEASPERPELRDLRRRLRLGVRDHERLATLIRWQRLGRPGADATAAGNPLAAYEVLRPLGDGSWGQAFLAQHRTSGEKVVLKRIRDSPGVDQDARASLLQEARVLLRLRHPNIVRLLDTLERPELILVLEFVSGGSLEARLSDPRYTVEGRMQAFQDVLAGLAEIHDQGFIHRDLTPSNVLLTETGQAKISDFGLAILRSHGRTRRTAATATAAAGSILYMAPEQARGDVVDARGDLYAVGAMVYRALTGHPHIHLDGLGELEALRRVAEAPAPRFDAALTSAVTTFLRRALAPDPRRRFRSAKEMSRALASIRSPPRAGRHARPNAVPRQV